MIQLVLVMKTAVTFIDFEVNPQFYSRSPKYKITLPQLSLLTGDDIFSGR